MIRSSGTDGPDEIFGGGGNDLVYGYGGNDQLWGDAQAATGGTGNDTIYGGTGNDDMIGGGGNDVFSAWSISPYVGTTFTGVYEDSQGDFNNTGGSGYQLESTGYDRMLGGPGNDTFYAGTGLDFMDANGGTATYYDKNGATFGGDVGAQASELQAYAQSTQGVWYVPVTASNSPVDLFYGQLTDQNGNVIGHARNFVQVGSNLQINCDYADWTNNLTVTVAASGGQFTLSYGGQSTAPLAYNALASTVEWALNELLPAGEQGDIAVSGTSTTQNGLTVTPYVISFVGSLAGLNPALITASNSGLTGAGAAISTSSSLFVTVTDSGGNFTLSYDGQSTPSLAYDRFGLRRTIAAQRLAPGHGARRYRCQRNEHSPGQSDGHHLRDLLCGHWRVRTRP